MAWSTISVTPLPRPIADGGRRHHFVVPVMVVRVMVLTYLACIALPPSAAAQEPAKPTPSKATESTEDAAASKPTTPATTTGSKPATTSTSTSTSTNSSTATSSKPAASTTGANPPVASTTTRTASVSPTQPSSDGPFIVVVHSKNELEELDASRVSKMFLKKVKRWSDTDKTPVEPVDQAQDSSVREAFTQAIHINKDLFAIKSYWQRMIFSGRMAPPPELRTDDEVLAFVRSRRGAIGYVRRGIELGEGVKALKINPDE